MFVVASLFLSYSDFPSNECSDRTNGNRGIIKRYKDKKPKFDKNLVSYHYVDRIWPPWTFLSGSICPKKSDYYVVRAERGSTVTNIYPAFDREYVGHHDSWNWPRYLYANRCYPFEIASDATSTMMINGKINGSIIDNSLVTLLDCISDDCFEGYYSDTCEHYVDVDCNGNGDPEWGRKSDGMGCICRQFTDNIFCEDTSKSVFDETRQGVKYYSYYDFNKIDISSILNDFSHNEFGESYSTIRLESKLYIPQNTDLQFQITSTKKSQVFIDGKQVIDTVLSDTFECQERELFQSETQREHFTKGYHNVTVIMNSGCAIYEQSISLKWKFYRWYRNNPSGYEDIPRRYLGIY